MKDNHALVEDIWQLVYDTFERPKITISQRLGMAKEGQQVEIRLMKNLAKLKQNTKDAEVLQAVRGDVMLAQTISKMTPERAEDIQLLLDKLEGTK